MGARKGASLTAVRPVDKRSAMRIKPHSERSSRPHPPTQFVEEPLILYTLTLSKEDRHLLTVWQLLNGTHPLVTDIARRKECGSRPALFLLLRSCEAFGGTVASAGINFGQMADKELQSVFSTTLTQLEFLDSDAMANVLSGSDLRLSDLKTKKSTLYLCLPATRMGTHAGCASSSIWR
jgi:Type IV secretory system Conjugative DNA transfer